MPDIPRHRLHVIPPLRRPGGLLFHDWLAITIGPHIWAWRHLGPAELAHEVEHVAQWKRYGALYPVRYLVASWQALRAGRHWYRENAFEIAARAAADAVGRR
jgi:hypothetical protein